MLSEAIFVGNAFTFVGETTPYHALYGRQPRVLPTLPDVRDGHPETSDAGERVVNRIREISTQSMIQTTAAGQLTRALRANTAIGGEG